MVKAGRLASLGTQKYLCDGPLHSSQGHSSQHWDSEWLGSQPMVFTFSTLCKYMIWTLIFSTINWDKNTYYIELFQGVNEMNVGSMWWFHARHIAGVHKYCFSLLTLVLQDIKPGTFKTSQSLLWVHLSHLLHTLFLYRLWAVIKLKVRQKVAVEESGFFSWHWSLFKLQACCFLLVTTAKYSHSQKDFCFCKVIAWLGPDVSPAAGSSGTDNGVCWCACAGTERAGPRHSSRTATQMGSWPGHTGLGFRLYLQQPQLPKPRGRGQRVLCEALFCSVIAFHYFRRRWLL